MVVAARPHRVKDEQALAAAIEEAAQVLVRESMLEEVVLKDLPERLETRAIDCCEEAAQAGSMRKLLPTKEGHKRVGKWGEPVKDGRDGRLATDGVAQQERDEVNHINGCASATVNAMS
jgi:hypothetical protein